MVISYYPFIPFITMVVVAKITPVNFRRAASVS
jgi:hypothetical protein